METVIKFLVRVLEGMFLAGLVGSVITILITTVDDVKVLMDKDPTPQHPE